MLPGRAGRSGIKMSCICYKIHESDSIKFRKKCKKSIIMLEFL